MNVQPKSNLIQIDFEPAEYSLRDKQLLFAIKLFCYLAEMEKAEADSKQTTPVPTELIRYLH
jgi:hypothetical protein